jgi:pSer/pThr/pTyr-binding forkhead associated (FHA) protein
MPRVTIAITNKQAQPYRFPLDRDDVTLGRGRDNDISIQSESVSVHHAKMRRVPGGYELRDLGSTNGLKLDGEKKIFVSLSSGMTIRIGEADFHFQLSDEEQEELAKEMVVDEELGDTKETAKVEAPKKKAKIQSADDDESISANRTFRNPQQLKTSSGSSGGMIVVFLILAAIVFFVGMAIRFHNETGGSLVESMRAKFQASEKPPVTPEPAK